MAPLHNNPWRGGGGVGGGVRVFVARLTSSYIFCWWQVASTASCVQQVLASRRASVFEEGVGWGGGLAFSYALDFKLYFCEWQVAVTASHAAGARFLLNVRTCVGLARSGPLSSVTSAGKCLSMSGVARVRPRIKQAQAKEPLMEERRCWIDAGGCVKVSCPSS